MTEYWGQFHEWIILVLMRLYHLACKTHSLLMLLFLSTHFYVVRVLFEVLVVLGDLSVLITCAHTMHGCRILSSTKWLGTFPSSPSFGACAH